MAIFISYSHEDREFVDRLALKMVDARANVWVDRWELQVGDSLVDKIQNAIEDADALLIVLSPAAVKSSWCRRELNAGFIRELEEERVFVLPVLIEDCELPPFLRDKYYADFREDFEQGLQAVLRSIAHLTSTTLGRTDDEEINLDFAIDWFDVDQRFALRLTIVEPVQNEPFTILTEITVVCNDILTSRYRQYEEEGLDWVGRGVILEMIKTQEADDLRVLLADDRPARQELRAVDPRTGVGADVVIQCRRVGEDTGKDILVDVGARASNIIREIQSRMRSLTSDELRRVQGILERPPDAR